MHSARRAHRPSGGCRRAGWRPAAAAAVRRWHRAGSASSGHADRHAVGLRPSCGADDAGRVSAGRPAPRPLPPVPAAPAAPATARGRDPFGLWAPANTPVRGYQVEQRIAPPAAAEEMSLDLGTDASPAAADGGEAQLREALGKASREVIEKIAWEVVPQLAETIIRERARAARSRSAEAKGLKQRRLTGMSRRQSGADFRRPTSLPRSRRAGTRSGWSGGYFRAEATSSKPPFCIVLPPPNVTGSLHLGHALTATLQDILIRWKRMSGFNALWLPGTDHAGIATQMVVERELKKTEKKTRHDLGREEFLKRVWAVEGEVRRAHRRAAQGARAPRSTGAASASPWTRASRAAVREVFVRLHEEGLIYRAQKLINWCPRCHTALSDLEVEHEEQQGSLWHIALPGEGHGPDAHRGHHAAGDDARATPRWPCTRRTRATRDLVGQEGRAAAGRAGDPDHRRRRAGEHGVRHRRGEGHAGARLQRLPDRAAAQAADDLHPRRARRAPTRRPGPYAGLDRFEARKKVLADLDGAGAAREGGAAQALASAPASAARTVVEPRLSPQWFVKIEPLAKPAIEAVEQGRTTLRPRDAGRTTYFHWMRNIHDWCISRQLWWGHQIPAWYCSALHARGWTPTGAHRTLERADAHRRPHAAGAVPQVRGLDVRCRTRTCWTPGSARRCGRSRTLGWPEQTRRARRPSTRPPSWRPGHDIIFFWVARMMMMGLHFMGDVPFRTVYLHAMVRDEKGEKMSKTKGNVIDPLDVIRGAPAESLPPTPAQQVPAGHAGVRRGRAALHAGVAHPAGAGHQALARSRRRATRPSATSCGTRRASR